MKRGIDFLLRAMVNIVYIVLLLAGTTLAKSALAAEPARPVKLAGIPLTGTLASSSATAKKDETTVQAVNSSFGQVDKGLSQQKVVIKATRLELANPLRPASLRFYSPVVGKNLRLAIYDNHTPKHLVWQSGLLSNLSTEAWLTVHVSDGDPASLSLLPGIYWLAWQSDNSAEAAGFTSGAPGDGFRLTQDYGDFPTTVSGEQLTNERWSLFLTSD